jgi:Ca-activated chloride channel family protein
MLALLPLPWLIYRWGPVGQPSGAALFLPFAATLAPASGVTGAHGRPTLGTFWFGLIWLLLLVAASRPQWLGPPQPVPTTARRVMLAVDVSGSMATQDMAGGQTRLQVVQEVAGRFIDGRHGDEVGLILFGTQPYLQAPLTGDLATVHQFLNEAVAGVAGPQTAIGDAIGLAIKRLRAARDRDLDAGLPDGAADDAQGDMARRSVLVLLTDGGNDAGIMSPEQAARLAAQTGLRIYTMGVGAAAGIGAYGATLGNTDLDEHTLRQIAAITGGQYFRANDADALQAVYQQINELEPAAGQQQWLRPASEWYTWPLALALLLSIPASWAAARDWD